MSSSVVMLRKSSDASSAVGFSFWMNSMDTERRVNVMSVRNVKVDEKTNLEHGKLVVDQSGNKKKLCLCAPTNHPGSFKCRYHRETSVEKVNLAQDPAAAVAKHFLKLGNNSKNTKPTVSGVKPQPSRFSKAAADSASNLTR